MKQKFSNKFHSSYLKLRYDVISPIDPMASSESILQRSTGSYLKKKNVLSRLDIERLQNGRRILKEENEEVQISRLDVTLGLTTRPEKAIKNGRIISERQRLQDDFKLRIFVYPFLIRIYE